MANVNFKQWIIEDPGPLVVFSRGKLAEKVLQNLKQCSQFHSRLLFENFEKVRKASKLVIFSTIFIKILTLSLKTLLRHSQNWLLSRFESKFWVVMACPKTKRVD